MVFIPWSFPPGKSQASTVHITHLSVFGFCRPGLLISVTPAGKIGNCICGMPSSYPPLATCATIFRLILISSTSVKNPAEVRRSERTPWLVIR
jgi:hypothetical protein